MGKKKKENTKEIYLEEITHYLTRAANRIIDGIAHYGKPTPQAIIALKDEDKPAAKIVAEHLKGTPLIVKSLKEAKGGAEIAKHGKTILVVETIHKNDNIIKAVSVTIKDEKTVAYIMAGISTVPKGGNVTAGAFMEPTPKIQIKWEPKPKPKE